MGSAGCSILRFSSLGHQSRFDLTLLAVCVNGHFASVDICSLLWSVGRRHHLRADVGGLSVPAVGLRLAREGLLEGVVALRSLQALSCHLASPLRSWGVS